MVFTDAGEGDGSNGRMKGQKTEYATVYRVIDICNEILSWILMVILVCLFCYGTYGDRGQLCAGTGCYAAAL